MNLTALKSWVSGETLTAADLNAEFQNIYTHTINNSDIDSTASYVLGELVIGAGLAAADGGQLHVHTGSAGTVQAASDADEAVFENSTASGITILSGGASTGKIAFGDAGDNDIGLITYNHATNAFTLGTNGATALTLSSAQAATFAGDVSVGGALTLTGGLTLNGAVVVGDSASDTLTVNATVTSDLLFTDATYDIGKSGATRPRDGFFSRNMAVGGTLGVTGATTLSSTLGVTGALTATAGITSGSDIVSDSDSTDDLGTTSVRWANLYVDSIGDTGQALAITAGSNNVNVTAGTLALTGAQTISSTLNVTGLITANGGVSGNISGNVTGNISGNVTGGTISGTTGTFSSYISLGNNGYIRGDASGELRFQGGSSGTTFYNSSNGTEYMRLTNAGLLGLGTPSPQGTLHARVATDKNIRLQVLGAYAGIGALNDDSSSYIQLNLEASDLVVGQYSGGNMGLGVVPSAWRSTETALQVDRRAALYADSHVTTALANNLIINSSGYALIEADAASQYYQYQGAHVWQTVGSGSAGAGVSPSTVMTMTSAGNLGLNTAAPASNAAIHAVTTAYSGASGAIILEDTRTNSNPYIQIKNDARQYNLQVAGARSDNFEIYDNGAGAIRLAVTSAGNFGVGTASAAYKTEIAAGASTEGLAVTASSGDVYLQTDGQVHGYQKLDVTSAGLQIKGFSDGGGAKTQTGRIYLTQDSAGSAGGEFRLYLNDGSSVVERLRVLKEGGITFNGDTATANALDDYEEGTWTPGMNGGTVSTYSARYTKIGNTVTVSCYLYNISPTDNSSMFQITGLPYTTSSATNFYHAGSIGYSGAAQMDDFGLLSTNNGTHLYLHYLNSTNSGAAATNTQILGRSITVMIVSITYTTT